MSLIGLGKIDRNLIPILIGCVICFLSRLLFQYDETKLFKHQILTDLLIAASKLLTIIPHIIIKKQIITVNKDDVYNQDDKKTDLIYNETNDATIFMEGKYTYIIISSVLYFVQSIILLFTINIRSNAWIIDILFTLVFYYLFFKIKLYLHHYLSIILIILTGITLDLIMENLQSDIHNHFLLLLLRLLRDIIYSIYEVINKYLMEKKFSSVYEIAFFNGLIALVLLVIFSVFDYYFFKMDNFREYFNNFNYIELLIILGTIITQLGLTICALFTSKNNTPCHIFIIYVFGNFAYYLNFSKNSIIKIICLLFIFFLSLIFNEIIEINCFGLSKNTKKNIINRAKAEEIYGDEKSETDDEEDIGGEMINKCDMSLN